MSSVAATQFLPVVATASAVKNYLVVSVHDVAPSTQAITEKIISEVARRGIRVCSLLVVPDYHHQGAAMKDRQFVSWLRDLEAQRHEIVIHGYFHERPACRAETLRDKFITQLYTQSEGEFYDMDYDEAFRRIKTARDEFSAAGLKPRGFVAPAKPRGFNRSEEHTSELQSPVQLVCRLLLEKKKKNSFTSTDETVIHVTLRRPSPPSPQ